MGLIDNEHAGFRSGRGCVGKIFALKQICEKHEIKKLCGFYGFREGII